ncbi:MAG: 4-alpha-glucanotransferase [Bacteroidota bacterium]|nr:4-alpha-glucanotransferase [Bacteroidota bacterium]
MTHLPRSSGLLLHVSSLPGGYGIGDLGPEAWRFAEACAAAGQTYWQILPICPTGFGYSPYASPASFAGSPELISPDLLVAEGLLKPEDLAQTPRWEPDQVNYRRIIPFKRELLQQAWQRFPKHGDTDALQAFALTEDYWLRDHAAFCVTKEANLGKPWPEWSVAVEYWPPESLLSGPQGYFVFEQFMFMQQWRRLHDRCRQLGVFIIGDLPIYVAHDSSDVWGMQDQFQLDSNGRPTVVAGVPPDFFSRTGQRWGNPIYDWERMAADGYRWWVKRLRRALDLFDIVRLDHFRGFAGYWEIPAAQPTAEVGRWVKGPGAALLESMQNALGPLPLIAEDLGVVTPDVPVLMEQFGLRGMVVLQFGFDSGTENPHLPHNHSQHLVAYTGTHDNDTLVGWWHTLPGWQRDFAREYLGLQDDAQLCAAAINRVLASSADLVITPVQDVLGLNSLARMNTPGTVGGNWAWRLTREQLRALQQSAGRQVRQWTLETGR